MLRFRLIPCLLVSDDALVKTIKFKNGKYVGDPLNAVRIFNEKEVDELIILDIDATAYGRSPDMAAIKHWAAECRMPLCYGGGVSTVEQIQEIISLGVEKVAINSSALSNPGLIKSASASVGSQSVVVIIDYKKRGFSKKYDVYTQNGTQRHKHDLLSWALEVEKQGAGEIVLNSIERDGTMTGYDTDVIRLIKKNISIPVTALGGAGSLSDVKGLVNEFGTIGAAAGSIFVFKGKYNAVLINYPSQVDKNKIK